MTDTNQLPPHTITIHDHPEPHIMQWSDLELAAVKRYAEQYALQARAQVQGGPMAWLHWLNGPVRVFMNKDEAMMELDRLNREYPLDTDDRKMRPLILGDTTPKPAQATQAEVTDEREAFESCTLMEGSLFKRRADDPDKYWDGNVQDDWELWQARATLALRHERVPMSMGKAVMYGTHLYAGIMKGEAREVKNSVLIEFSSRQDLGAFLRWHDGITAQAKKETP